jgi:hypothetical protein
MRINILCSILFLSLTSYAQTEFAIIGDAGRINKNSQSVMQSILNHGVTQLILPGDNLYSSTYEKVWKTWQDHQFDFSVVAIGNHNAGYAAEVNYFQMPGEYYKRSIGFADFIVLNSDNPKNVSAQMVWLDNELQNTTMKNVFLVYHHPTYTISKVHGWTDRKAFQIEVRKRLKKFRSKITALMVGHDHLASLIHFGDLPVILSGAVQEVRKDAPVDYVTEGVHIKTAWYFDHTPHWAQLVVTSTGATVDFIKAQTNQVNCSVRLYTGSMAVMGENCEQN